MQYTEVISNLGRLESSCPAMLGGNLKDCNILLPAQVGIPALFRTVGGGRPLSAPKSAKPLDSRHQPTAVALCPANSTLSHAVSLLPLPIMPVLSKLHRRSGTRLITQGGQCSVALFGYLSEQHAHPLPNIGNTQQHHHTMQNKDVPCANLKGNQQACLMQLGLPCVQPGCPSD
jgi:hypothetical protein